MSGHSHWHRIRYKKGLTDAKRSKAFSKISRLISVATREGGGDPLTNSNLRLAIEKAKAINLPKENIKKAIKRGVGELEGVRFEEVVFEAYGPGGIAIIIEGITDNKNRTIGEIKQILTKNGGKLVREGSVRWLFEKKVVITVLINDRQPSIPKEELELKAIEAGAEDIYWHNDNLDIYTKIENLEEVKKNLEERGIRIESASLDWVAKKEILLDEQQKEACQRLFDALDESDAVQEIYSNLKI